MYDVRVVQWVCFFPCILFALPLFLMKFDSLLLFPAVRIFCLFQLGFISAMFRRIYRMSERLLAAVVRISVSCNYFEPAATQSSWVSSFSSSSSFSFSFSLDCILILTHRTNNVRIIVVQYVNHLARLCFPLRICLETRRKKLLNFFQERYLLWVADVSEHSLFTL